MRFGHCAIALGLLTLTVRAGAQTMPEKVPADALVYVGWEGSVALGKSYDASHLKGMIDALGLKEYIAAALQKQQQGRDAAKLEQEQLAQDLFTAVSKSPTVFYCGPFDFSVQPPRPRIAVFSKVGAADATALAARLNKAAKDSTDPKKQPTEASAEQEMLTVLVGDAADLKTRLAGAKEHSLSTLKEFQDAMNSLSGAKHEQAPACVFINAELALQSINEGVAASDNAQARMGWPKVVDALGLDAIRNMAWIGRFDGADWTNDSLVSFTAKRSGLAGFLDNKPLSADALKMIPKNATVASVIRFDGVRLLNDIRAAATRADERGAQIFDAGLNQLFFFTGVDFQKDLLPALSDEFVIYAAPDADGKSVRGLTLVNKLKDAKIGEESLNSLETFINGAIAQRTGNTKMQFQTEALKAPFEKVTMHTLTLEKAQPSWAVSDGVLYVSPTPAGVQAAVEKNAPAATEKAKSESLADNPQFAALKKKLGVEKMSSFLYVDLAKAAPESYDLISQAIAAEQKSPDAKAAPYTLPSLEKLQPHLTPGLEVYWSDDAGWHSRGIGPFPMWNTLSPEQLTLQAFARQAGEDARKRREQKALP